MKKKRIRINILLYMLLTLLIVPFSLQNVYGKKIENKGKITLYPNMSKTMKLPVADTEVVWTVSGKNVQILGTRGKQNRIATIKTGNKTGSATLKAKVGKKVYSWKIRIKDDSKVPRVTLKKVTKTNRKLDISVNVCNPTDDYIEYGKNYSIEKFEHGRWKRVNMKPGVGYAVEDVAICVMPGCSVKESFSLGYCYDIPNFKKGVYRIKVNVLDGIKKGLQYAIFEIE